MVWESQRRRREGGSEELRSRRGRDDETWDLAWESRRGCGGGGLSGGIGLVARNGHVRWTGWLDRLIGWWINGLAWSYGILGSVSV